MTPYLKEDKKQAEAVEIMVDVPQKNITASPVGPSQPQQDLGGDT